MSLAIARHCCYCWPPGDWWRWCRRRLWNVWLWTCLNRWWWRWQGTTVWRRRKEHACPTRLLPCLNRPRTGRWWRWEVHAMVTGLLACLRLCWIDRWRRREEHAWAFELLSILKRTRTGRRRRREVRTRIIQLMACWQRHWTSGRRGSWNTEVVGAAGSWAWCLG